MYILPGLWSVEQLQFDAAPAPAKKFKNFYWQISETCLTSLDIFYFQ